VKQKREEEGGEDESKEEKVVSASVIAWHFCTVTLYWIKLCRRFEYSDITAAWKICTTMRRCLNSAQKQVTIIGYF
jgi:hypothetical protein